MIIMSLNKIRLQERTNTTQSGMHIVFQITLPVGIIDSLGWKKGDVLILKKISDRISIKKSGGL